MHVVNTSPRQDTGAQRKRPKYTRSKTGCLTCRAKKIKVSRPEASAISVLRAILFAHAGRQCTWPEGVPSRKKPLPKREPAPETTGFDTRPSTAGSSGLSEASTPPIRDHTPPKREPIELGLPPMASRRHPESSLHMPVMTTENGVPRRQQTLAPIASGHGYPVHSNSHTHGLPALPEMSTSYSSHTTQYHHSYSGHQYGHTQSLALPRVSAHAQHDMHPVRSMESSSHSGQWSSPPMLTPIDPIEPFFPTVQERNLIRHYCDHALSIIMAYPSENPVLAANLHFVLGRSPGSDTAVEALRMALLGVAAIHQSFLLSRDGSSQGGAEQVMRLAMSYRAKAEHLLATATTTSDGIQNDAALSAAVSITLIDIFSGGYNWAKAIDTAKNLINARGGPAVLLARSGEPKPGTVTGVWRARLILEIVAVYEIFGCLASRQEPTLLSSVTSSWWSDRANSVDSQSYVEKVFGVSRALVPVLARVTALLARVHRSQAAAPDSQSAYIAPGLPDQAEAHALYDLLESWYHSSDDAPDRVRAGNRVYQNAAQILLLRDVLGRAPDDRMVQHRADCALTLCLDCANANMGVDLSWPVIIAASQLYVSKDRSRHLYTRFTGCYEIDTAEHIVVQVWKRLDSGVPRADWRSIMIDHDINALIL
ncbi:hypothetical protein OBBRIDRAFT_810069 [Obba rivulosa]|uniref:Uncharacterized protein n=1 Tax=Obba rivulosa TaxID=1052685 RepID=A0A8E2DSL5_9APHY|nr:hypothetical protein OBBRIDRAFT_810069 [Obba rivulosa]